MTYDSMFWGTDLRTEEAGLRYVRAGLRQHVTAGLRPGRGARWVNLRPERVYMRLGMAN